MKDFLKNDLSLNDKVIFVAPSYRSLVIGTIIGLTKEKVRIEYVNTWNYPSEGRVSNILQYPAQVLRIGE